MSRMKKQIHRLRRAARADLTAFLVWSRPCSTSVLTWTACVSIMRTDSSCSSTSVAICAQGELALSGRAQGKAREGEERGRKGRTSCIIWASSVIVSSILRRSWLRDWTSANAARAPDVRDVMSCAQRRREAQVSEGEEDDAASEREWTDRLREDLRAALRVLPCRLDLVVGRVGLDCEGEKEAGRQHLAELEGAERARRRRRRRASERGKGRTDLDLAGHAVAVLLAAALLDEVVLLEGALEAVLEVADLELARCKVGVALRALLVDFVELGDAVPDRVGEPRRLVRQLRELGGRGRLGLVVGRREAARVELRDVVDVVLELLDLVLDRLDLRTSNVGRESAMPRLRAGRSTEGARPRTSAKNGPRSDPMRLPEPPFMGCMA